MVQRGSYCAVLMAAAAAASLACLASGQLVAPDGGGIPEAEGSLVDWRDPRDLRELRDLRDEGGFLGGGGVFHDGGLVDMKRAFHAMRGKKAAPFHAMRGKKLKGANGDISTIIAELRRQIMAGKRGSFFGMRGKRFGGPADLEAEVAAPIMEERR